MTFSSSRQQAEYRLLFGCRRQQTEGFVGDAAAVGVRGRVVGLLADARHSRRRAALGPRAQHGRPPSKFDQICFFPPPQREEVPLHDGNSGPTRRGSKKDFNFSEMLLRLMLLLMFRRQEGAGGRCICQLASFNFYDLQGCRRSERQELVWVWSARA